MMSVPVEQFGKDHWSVLGYIGCRVTGNKGVPDNNHMRTDPDRHPALVGPMLNIQFSGPKEERKKYPTRLAGGIELPDHDDWDCADDLEAAGLIGQGGTGINPIFSLTDKGWQVFKTLTEFKAKGGTFATFKLEAACAK